MAEHAPLEPDQQWQADSRVLRRFTPALGLFALSIGISVLMGIYRRPPHFFETYEGDGSAPRIEDAKAALEKIVPLGSTMADYNAFFRKYAGECWTVADVVRFPNSAICSYRHGFLVTSEWRYVIDYDPITFRSKQAELDFGLTGM